jgi:predicted aspartyl protease
MGNWHKSCLIFLLLTNLFIISSCNYIKNVQLLSAGKLMRENFVDSLSFEYKKGLIVVQAQLNDSPQKHDFIFDTGAFESKVEWDLATKLELPTKATKSNSTAQGVSQTVEVTQLKRIKLGHTTFSTISAGKLKYADTSFSQCIAEDGIIGANLIKLAHWKINYQNKHIYFSDKPFNIPTDVAPISFKKPLLSGVPEISLTIEGKVISGVLFDVGFNGGLIVPASLSDAFTSKEEKHYLDQSTSGIFGTNIDTLTTKQLQVSIGGVDMIIPVEFSSIGKALLGNEILEHFEVSINYDMNTISLMPRTQIEVEEPHSFIPGILNDSLWVVDRTTPELPFLLGDTLISINGYRPKELFNNKCDYFFTIQKLIKLDTLVITKNDKSIIKLISNN